MDYIVRLPSLGSVEAKRPSYGSRPKIMDGQLFNTLR